jgi:halocyanin-like protein
MNDPVPRRTVLQGIGLTTTAGLLAGCSSESDGGNGEGDAGDGGSDESTEDVPADVDDYLSDAMEYDGSMVDMTGDDKPTVNVGAGNGLAFGPPAIRVAAGTTLTWIWTGQGGGHNVVHEDGDFDSGPATTEEGNEFQHTFEEAGTYLYHCEPHKLSGMKGAVVVE